MMSYGAPTPAKPMRHPRINLLGICGVGFLPWVIFATLFAVATFCRSSYPGVYLAAFAGVFIVIALLIDAEREASPRRKSVMVSGGYHKNTMVPCMVVMLLFAWVLAFLVGLHNFKHNVFPWFEMMSFDSYVDVDPAARQGTEVMDGGKVSFVSTAKLDFSKSMGFKREEWWCVAPIVNGTKPLAHYDFWAVGKNCCPGPNMRFMCGAWFNPSAHAGIRWTHTEDRDYFRLAVQQAEATFKIQAQNPLFFEWVQDPEQVAEEWHERATTFYVYWICGFFVFNILVVFGAMMWACVQRRRG